MDCYKERKIMKKVTSEIIYWQIPGKENTIPALEAALRRAKRLKIGCFVVASCTGYTIKKLLAIARGLKIVSVTHHAGFAGPGKQEMNARTIRYLQRRGVSVLTATHFFGGFGRAIRFKFGGLEPEEMAANTLRIFGEGAKVAVEVAVMALDAGMIPYGREVIAIGGTGEGADTAIVCLPKHGKDFFSFEVREIICKPRKR
jgi:hypothetical protein